MAFRLLSFIAALMTKSPHARAMPRNSGIDTVRIVMTMLVILHHTAIEYGGSGGWFWREQPNASNLPLVMFNAINQSYFMGLFFLLAGYYTPRSFDRKGPLPYLADRLVRLGIPLLAFFFVLYPLTNALADAAGGSGVVEGWLRRMAHGPYGPGPLWFAIALLIFAFAYAAWRAVRPHGSALTAVFPRWPVVLLAIAAIGLAAFIVRLVMPVGREILWLQLGFFPSYIALFAAGTVAAPTRLLERISFRAALPWLIVAGLAIASLPLVAATRGAAGGFEGGMNLNAFYYALWEPCVATGVILGLLVWARRRSPAASPTTEWLAAGAFGAFIIHPPVLVALSVMAASWHAAPLLKFLLVGLAACGASFALAGLARTVPGIRRVI
ncbi:MAG: acyltransferase [Sphingomonas phyllosphaerae]